MKRRGIFSVLTLLLFIFAVGFLGLNTVYGADESVSIVEIDYEKETLTLKANSADTKLFFSSNVKSKVWDEVYGKLDTDKKITMDISWASKSSNVTFYVKGDYSETPVKIVLPKQSTTFKPALNLLTNEMTFSNVGSATLVYWRKSTSSVWNIIQINKEEDMAALKEELERFSLQGITLYFRTAQVKGTGNSQGARPSKEVSVKIAKRASAPSVKVDYSALTISAKNTMEYKKSEDNQWIAVADSNLSIQVAAPETLYKENGDSAQEVSIDVRVRATQTKVASQTRTIVIPAQSKTEEDNILIEYAGANQLRITVFDLRNEDNELVLKGASSTNMYEYAVLKEDTDFDAAALAWTAISTTSPSAVTSTKAPTGSTICVRKKATADNLAAEPVFFSVGAYPTASTIEATTNLSKIKGVEGNLESFVIKVPNSITTVSSITFAGKAVKFTAGTPIKIDDYYAVTITITDVAAVEALSSNLKTILDGVIILDNGDKIEKGVTLYITPAAVLSSKAETIYKDIATKEDMEFVLNLGDDTKSDVTVTKVTINDIDFNYTAEADAGDNKKVKVTLSKTELDVYADGLENGKFAAAIPVVVTLSNGEVIKSGVTLTVKYVATATSSSAGMGISASAYLQSLAEAASGSSISQAFSNPTLTITIDSAVFAKDYDFSVTKVLWEGSSVMKNFTYNAKGDVITVTLDVGRIVAATDMTTQDSYSSTVRIELKSLATGDVISLNSTYKITVVE